MLLQNEKCKNLLLVGDLNLDILSDGEHVDVYNSILAEHGLFSFLNEATRPDSGKCLDHVVGRFDKPQSCYNCFNFDLGISDHCMTGINLSAVF